MTPDASGAQDDLRPRVSTVLSEQSTMVVADAARFLPLVGAERIDGEDAAQIARLLSALLSRAVRDGRIDPLSELITDLQRILQRRAISMEHLFSFAYLVERTALDELSLHPALGATMEPWPGAVQLIRRASFDLLAALAERTRVEPTGMSLLDPLTSLFSRPVFDAVLAKELDRAGRLGQSISVMLFELNDWSRLTTVLGPGVGDKVLERVGVLVRGFFRQSDWVVRYSDRSFAVLLVGGDAAEAGDLAERLQKTVVDRLELSDVRTNQPVRIALTSAVINRDIPPGQFVDAERLMAEAEAALRS